MSSKLTSPGLNNVIINALGKYISDKESYEKDYVLIFDEMSIKPNLQYEKRSDSVVGFENFGSSGNSKFIANHVLVLMLRSLRKKIKLPIGYYFSHGSIKSELLKKILVEAIKSVHDVGIRIRAIICDQSGSNCGLFSLLNISISNPFFDVDGEKLRNL